MRTAAAALLGPAASAPVRSITASPSSSMTMGTLGGARTSGLTTAVSAFTAGVGAGGGATCVGGTGATGCRTAAAP